ncbi:hypothetical protein BGX23_004165, partial [Mortierella sp. AD031]
MTDGTQSFRRGADNKVENIDVFYDPETSQQVVYWDDIQLLFPHARCIKNGDTLVAFAHMSLVTSNTTLESCSKWSRTKTLLLKSLHISTSFVLFESTDPQLGIESLALHETSTASSTSAATAVSISTDRHALASPSSASRRLLLRTQSMLQESSAQLVQHENAIRAGQIVQADAIKQGIQTMVDIRGGILVLRSEVAKNDELRELRQQILDLQTAADVQARRMEEMHKASVELQERSIKMQREALDRLALIQNKVAAIMIQSYELHEYPIPRLFIVLPKESTSRTETLSRGVKDVFATQFKLYFLCECGDHTKPTDGRPANPNLKHKVHIARHEGYDIDRPTEFFDKYGSYILTLLQMLKYGVAIVGAIVPPLGQLKLVDSLEGVHEVIKHILEDLGPRVDSSIAYIEGLNGVQNQLSSESSSTSFDS